ncbi:MAG: hypothetical protein WCP30_15635 [Mycobacteriaceae bacterium]
MLNITKLATGLTTVALTVALSPVAAADPAIPLDPGQLPGMQAVQSLSPVIQQAAANPKSAQELLLAAAAQLAGNATTPEGSLALAQAVSKFVQEGGAAGFAPPAAAVVSNQAGGPVHGATPLMTPGTGNGPMPLELHVPAPGAVPGTEAHLPSGINPANAVGPAAEAMPEVPTPVAAPAPPPDAAAPVALAAPGPAPAPSAAAPYDPAKPPTQDFLYPSISNGCQKDGGNVIATAISVAGPAKIPAPGPNAGQMAYVFTAVGTPAPAAEQKLPLNVTWVNLTTGRSGSATLKPNPAINPQGPTTLTAIVDTGSGSVMSTIFGQVTTLDNQCTFMPTIGSSVVP